MAQSLDDDSAGTTPVPVPSAPRPSAAPSASPRPDGRTADVYAVLADPTRRRLLTALRGQEKSVGDLVIELAVSQPTVSKHLRTLREGGLVRMRASGQRRLYSIRLEPLQEAARWIGEFMPAPVVAVTPAGETTDGGRRATEAGVAARATSGTAYAGSRRPAAPGETPETTDEDGSSPIGRTVGRAAGRAAEMIANIPRLRRRNGRY
ncbi:metalloregulator ArsR/SmtB family transcription factor [Tersicoccus sp. MR15.9]|uniref:ArsR/SmtB family transcription factor n=1 Tax=Tersicoccus mangrovi TaxID=3121635 RepID=UPI002FE5FCCD